MRALSGRNKTIRLDKAECLRLQSKLIRLQNSATVEDVRDRTIHQDLFEAIPFLPAGFVDLLFIDPPYNLTKIFGTTEFKQKSIEDYQEWLESWFPRLMPLLKPDASVYICGDWRSAAAIQLVASKYLHIHSCITWERDKGRGAKRNWKNCSEQIWFCSNSQNYTFNVEAVKLKRRVIAPYRDGEGSPKDWESSTEGKFRLTFPSNFWSDLTIPFWSMPENTDHPTQKPEKLLAKIILASSNPGDHILDPFAGVGTSSVVSKKTGRHFTGIEIDQAHCCMTEKRLELAENNPRIQGYHDGVFWERNARN